MTKRIYKYTLPMTGPALIEVPHGAKLLPNVHVQDVQAGTPTVWFLVDPEETKKVAWEAYVAVTGEYLPDALDKFRYVGTFQIDSLPGQFGMRYFVGHVFMLEPQG